jgi:lysozyme
MMTDEMQIKLKRSLIEHEGLKEFPYVDTLGNVTIGIGYNLSSRGLPDAWINVQYNQDVQYFYEQLCTFPWYLSLNQDRQIILIDMAFMGWKRFLGFTEMIAALERKDYLTASHEMLNSEWALEVKNRATELAAGMLSGVYNV